jgi:hypothetical protein
MAKKKQNPKKDQQDPPANPGNNVETNSTLKKIGKETLVKNPQFSAVYVTSDGYVFASESDARNNAKTLENQEVVTVKK